MHIEFQKKLDNIYLCRHILLKFQIYIPNPIYSYLSSLLSKRIHTNNCIKNLNTMMSKKRKDETQTNSIKYKIKSKILNAFRFSTLFKGFSLFLFSKWKYDTACAFCRRCRRSSFLFLSCCYTAYDVPLLFRIICSRFFFFLQISFLNQKALYLMDINTVEKNMNVTEKK